MIDLTELPVNLFFNVYRTGSAGAITVKNMQWHLPVLAFAQPRIDSEDWYIVPLEMTV